MGSEEEMHSIDTMLRVNLAHLIMLILAVINIYNPIPLQNPRSSTEILSLKFTSIYLLANH